MAIDKGMCNVLIDYLTSVSKNENNTKTLPETEKIFVRNLKHKLIDIESKC